MHGSEDSLWLIYLTENEKKISMIYVTDALRVWNTSISTRRGMNLGVVIQTSFIESARIRMKSTDAVIAA